VRESEEVFDAEEGAALNLLEQGEPLNKIMLKGGWQRIQLP